MEKSKIELAPIILFCYNRPGHTRLTLESLKKNRLAEQSLLYIFVDGPKPGATAQQLQAIDLVKTVIRQEQWCAEVIISESSVNQGLAKSLVGGVSEVVERHGKAIVLEDDLVTDHYFLDFMNQALHVYEQDEEVACISGYIYPTKETLPPNFFLKGADCWGWATWKRAWSLYQADGNLLLQEIKQRGAEREFDFDNSYPYVQMLKDQISGKNDSWAIRWYASAFLHNKLCLYPGHSLIQNIGNDGSGTHAGTTNQFNSSLKNQPLLVQPILPEEDEEAKQKVIRFFKSLRSAPQKQGSLLSRLYQTLLPYRLRAWLYRWRHPAKGKTSLWSGNYSSWQAVMAECTGYDSALIFEKVKQATLAVKEGKASFERDSVLFYEPDFKEEFIQTMDRIAAEHHHKLRLIDFGGSLGSVYFQYKSKFEKYQQLTWCVVEQGHFVKFGQEHLQDNELQFFDTIDHCLQGQEIDVVLLSSVLSYLEKPYELLEHIVAKGLDYVVIDRTLVSKHQDQLCKQQVPEEIYKASYPCWVLNRDKLVNFMSGAYTLEKEFDPYQGEIINIDTNEAYFTALVFKKK